MMSGRDFARIAMFSAVIGLTGCTTVKLPDIDFLKMTGFFDDKNKIDDYPKVSDVPSLPTSIREGEVWDAQANELIKIRDEFNDLDDYGVAKSDADISRDIDALKAKVRAYKADDPQ